MSFVKKFLAAAMTLAVFFLPNFAEGSTIMRKLPVEVLDTGGTLLFSDSPEYVTRDGILYTDMVRGDVRVLFYHLNSSHSKKKIAVVVEDLSGRGNTIEITRGGFSAPSEYYLSVGKLTQIMYMKDDFQETLKLKKRERKLLQEEMDFVAVDPGNLVYGVYDFHVEGLVQVSVLMCPYDSNPLEFIDGAEILPKDEQMLRGTFKRMNRTIKLLKEYDPSEGIGYIMIGDDVNDFFREGIDATDGSKVVNVGNYGIKYTIDFRTKSLTRFCLSPLGGIYAGAVRFNHAGDSGMIPTPERKTYFGEKTRPEPESVRLAREEGTALFTRDLEISELGKYSGKVTFEYSPPGASNLPVHFVLLPVNGN